MIYYNRHYIITDARNCIIDAWSDGPHPERDTSDAICINEKGSYQLYFTISGNRTDVNPQRFTVDGIPLYRWDGEQIVPRTETEIAADRAAIPEPPPSPQEQLRADVDFLAAMQGVTL